MPTYRVLVCDTRSGSVLDELPYTSFQLEASVDWARGDQFSVTVPLLGARHQSRGRIVGLRKEPWKRSLCLLRGTVPVWAGPIVSHDWEQQSISFTCAGLPKLLDKRFIFRDHMDTVTINADARDAIASLLSWSVVEWVENGDARYQLPLSGYALLGGSGATGRTYSGRDLPTVYESVKKVTEEEHAPDVRLKTVIDPDQTQIGWEAVYGDPYLGSVDPSVTWDYPGNIESLTGGGDGTSMTVRGFVLGDGQEDDRLIMSAENDLADDGFPWMDAANRNASSSRDTFVVQALADSFARTGATLTESWDVDVRADVPGIEGWELGDNHLFRITGHTVVDNGEYVRRTTGYRLTADSLSLETLPALEVPS